VRSLKTRDGTAAATRTAGAFAGVDRQIAAIHVLKARLKLTDDDYRVLLKGLTAKTSSKDCTPAERAKVREHMHRLVERAGVARPRASAVAFEAKRVATRPLERKVWAMWNALGRAGKLDNPAPAALQAWVKRQTGLDHLRFCSDFQIHGLIEAMKLWEGRT
jgi:phage gp16-like protein